MILRIKYSQFIGDEVDARSHLNLASTEDESLRNVCLSQPEFPRTDNGNTIQFNLDERPAFSFSQPAHMEDLLLCTQLQALTQPSQVQHALLNNVPRYVSQKIEYKIIL